MTNLVIPSPSTPAYDAYVTYTQDEGIGYVNPYDVELWLPFPGPDGGGTCAVIDGEGTAPPPGMGAKLAALVVDLPDLERVLVKVHGVPCPGWAIELYRDFLAELDGRLPCDLLAVQDYRWQSWVLSGGLATAA
ncbi:MAG TPA: hypothetical protein VNB94_04285 [Mycobacteriales bacterium]|nr:hypothetical protein [Mycobacteriales bacterium]